MDYLSIQKSWHAILVAMVVAQFNRPNPRRPGGGFEIALQIGELFDLGGQRWRENTFWATSARKCLSFIKSGHG
jgi:hypothetical protein